jgi:predicted nucleic acid-binding protein
MHERHLLTLGESPAHIARVGHGGDQRAMRVDVPKQSQHVQIRHPPGARLHLPKFLKHTPADPRSDVYTFVVASDRKLRSGARLAFALEDKLPREMVESAAKVVKDVADARGPVARRWTTRTADVERGFRGTAALDLILDTTVLIDAERAGTPLDDLIDDQDSVSIAAVTYAELLHGVEMADGRRRQQRRQFVEAVAGEVPIIAYDRRVAATHGGTQTPLFYLAPGGVSPPEDRA